MAEINFQELSQLTQLIGRALESGQELNPGLLDLFNGMSSTQKSLITANLSANTKIALGEQATKRAAETAGIRSESLKYAEAEKTARTTGVANIRRQQAENITERKTAGAENIVRLKGEEARKTAEFTSSLESKKLRASEESATRAAREARRLADETARSSVQTVYRIAKSGGNVEDAMKVVQALNNKPAELAAQKAALGGQSEYNKSMFNALSMVDKAWTDAGLPLDALSAEGRKTYAKELLGGNADWTRDIRLEAVKVAEAQKLASAKLSMEDELASIVGKGNRKKIAGLFSEVAPGVASAGELAKLRMPLLEAAKAAAKSSRNMKLGIGGGIAALLAAPLLNAIMGGGKKDKMDPKMQMMLAQQLGQMQNGGDIGSLETGRTLNSVSKLLTIIKAIQGVAGANPQPQNDLYRLA